MVSDADAITVMMWLKMNEEPLHGTTLLGQEAWEPCCFVLKIYNPQDLWGPPPMLWFHTFAGSVDVKNYWGDISEEIGRWIHVVVTYDEKVARIYVNGKRIISKAVVNHYPLSVGPTTIGCRKLERHVGGFFNGLIDDVRIYNYALRKAEVSAIYNDTRWTLTERGGVLHFRHHNHSGYR